jgi:hypothetical protein
VDGERDAVELHRLLFPVGERQRASLGALGGGPSEAAFLAWHRGIAAGLASVARAAGARGRLVDWLLVRDEGVASELLWGGDPAEEVARRGERAFLDAAGDVGERYCRVVAPDLRHRLGEHYTPRWLVDRVVDEPARGGAVVADPACGDGRFLVALLARGHDPDRLWGADLNPLAVLMARINVWLATGRPVTPPPVRIAWADFILGGAELPDAGCFVGNPPWVTWRNLSDGYRSTVAARMAGSRLHHTRGWAARVAAGQADLSHVFVHEAVERVAPAGQVVFVLPRSTFKAPAGPGRLREGVATSGRRYRFRQVWDCREADPFVGVRGGAVVGFVDVDEPHAFPVRWAELDRQGIGGTAGAVLSDPDDPGSPWLTDGRPVRLAAGGQRWTGLRARGGINTGGGNPAFHVAVLARRADTVTVQSVPSRLPPVMAEVEPVYLRPLLRGRDVAAWRAVPSGHIVLPHDPADLRRPVPETELARIAPLTYAYLLQFKDLLSARPERRRWRSEVWYTLFRLGPYTAGCWRVVWPHSAGARLRAAVLPPDDPAVPDQKVVLVPFDAPEPALFLCALLNSAPVRRASAHSGGMDASPNLVRRLVLPRFDGADPAHRAIVDGAGAGAWEAVAERAARLFSTGVESAQ